MPDPVEGLTSPAAAEGVAEPTSQPISAEGAAQPTPTPQPAAPAGPQFVVGLTAEQLQAMGIDSPEDVESFKKLHPNILKEGLESAKSKRARQQQAVAQDSLAAERKELEHFLNDYVEECHAKGYQPTQKDILLAQHEFTLDRAEKRVTEKFERKAQEKQAQVAQEQDRYNRAVQSIVFSGENADIFGSPEDIKAQNYRNPVAVREFEKALINGATPDQAIYLIKTHLMPYIKQAPAAAEQENVIQFKPQGSAGRGSVFFDTPNNMGQTQPKDEHATAHEALKSVMEKRLKGKAGEARGDALLNMFDD